MQKEVKEGFPITTIREINLLLGIQHPNIVAMREILAGNSVDKVYVVMEYMEHELKHLMENVQHNFSWGETKSLLFQLLKGIEYLHGRNIIHRDLKPSNILYDNRGTLKICDFGLARKYNPAKTLTPVVVTLWYRAPELLLGQDRYTKAIDIWSIGCIFAELLLKEPFLPGKNETEQIDLIFRTLGCPTDTLWPGWRNLPFARSMNFPNYQGINLTDRITPSVLSEQGLALLKEMLHLDPSKRITAFKALDHPYFKEDPPANPPGQMPSFPCMNEQARPVRQKKPK